VVEYGNFSKNFVLAARELLACCWDLLLVPFWSRQVDHPQG
jgi:hypothetical protein